MSMNVVILFSMSAPLEAGAKVTNPFLSRKNF